MKAEKEAVMALEAQTGADIASLEMNRREIATLNGAASWPYRIAECILTSSQGDEKPISGRGSLGADGTGHVKPPQTRGWGL